MDVLHAGIGATIQPGAAMLRLCDPTMARIKIADRGAKRRNVVANVPEEELPPAALAARVRPVRLARPRGREPMARSYPS